jgi:hypothetical protein
VKVAAIAGPLVHRWALAMLPLLGCAQGPANAHAFGARYELPAPVWLFIVGGALTVTLTFIVVAAFARAGAERFAGAYWGLTGTALGRLLGAAWLRALLQVAGVAVLVLVVAAGFAGTSDPNHNIAPTMIWIVWWVGFSYFVMLIGNLWPLINPWRTIYDWAARWQKGTAPSASPRPWPERLGSWPALALLLLFGWIELVFPFRADPRVLSWLVLTYSAITWTGMARYGPQVWLDHADPFHRLFELLSRFAPFSAAPHRGLILRPPAAGLLSRDSAFLCTAQVAFVVALLAIVLFDGLQSSKHWLALEDAIHAIDPTFGDLGWIALHSVGLLAAWLVFLGLYVATCMVMRVVAAGDVPAQTIARSFAPTLIPIAIGYYFAHSYTYLLVQGQALGYLVSDPLGLGWNLFGTRDFTIDIAIIGTRTAWYIALGSIVLGHAISVYLAHVVAERLLDTRARALKALVPMTVLMVVYTVISLQILAEPLVRYSGPQETII